MVCYLVAPSTLKGKINIPPSKSHTLRAILFGALGCGKTIIQHPLESPDARAMINACHLLGATIHEVDEKIVIDGINGNIEHAEDVINAGNSGLVLRMITAIASLCSLPIVVTGDYSIRHQRPMGELIKGLEQLGVSVISTKNDGYAPIIVKGPLCQGKTVISGEDSQPVSSLLIASIFSPGPVEIEVLNPGEKPWVSLTLDWFKRLGINCQHDNFHSYRIAGRGTYKGFEYSVPGDWSSAAFPIAAALITNSEVTIANVDFEDCQGDKAILEIFQEMGAHFDIDQKNKQLHVRAGNELRGIDVDINDCVDAITILAAVGCFAKGRMRIFNASIAKHKECDRIRCISQELRKMGGDLLEHDDGLTIRQSSLKGSNVMSYHDHRMAMALAVAALGAQGTTQIDNVECVAKTFPSFVKDFAGIGAQLREWK